MRMTSEEGAAWNSRHERHWAAAKAWEFVVWLCGIWATPALPVPLTWDMEPTAFSLGAHSSHLCVGTRCDSCSTAAWAIAQFKAGSGKKCHFLHETDGERHPSQEQEKSLLWFKFDQLLPSLFWLGLFCFQKSFTLKIIIIKIIIVIYLVKSPLQRWSVLKVWARFLNICLSNMNTEKMQPAFFHFRTYLSWLPLCQ